MFQMLGVFAEFERAMIQEPDQGRVGSGVGGWEDVGETENVNRRTGIVEAIRSGLSIRRTAKLFGVSPVKVQRVLAT